jgi:hypothetical protein
LFIVKIVSPERGFEQRSFTLNGTFDISAILIFQHLPKGRHRFWGMFCPTGQDAEMPSTVFG